MDVVPEDQDMIKSHHMNSYSMINVPVEGTQDTYKVQIHPKVPGKFTLVPTSTEIFQRLVLRALLTDTMDELEINW